MATRCNVAAARVHSRLLYLAGLWPGLTKAQQLVVRRAYYKPLPVVAGMAGPPASGDGRVANAAVARHTVMLPAEWELVLQRLRTAARFSRFAPSNVRALVASVGGATWRQAVCVSLLATQRMLPGNLRWLPDPRVDTVSRRTLRTTYPGAWKALLCVLRKRILEESSQALVVIAEFHGL